MWWLKPLPLCNLGPSHSVQEEENEGETEDEEEEDDRRKRRRSDSYSLTFDESLSWCVIGGLGRVRDLQSSQSSDTHSTVRIWQTHTLRKLSSYPENKTTNTRIKIPERNWKSLNQGLKPSSLHGTFSHFNTCLTLTICFSPHSQRLRSQAPSQIVTTSVWSLKWSPSIQMIITRMMHRCQLMIRWSIWFAFFSTGTTWGWERNVKQKRYKH